MIILIYAIWMVVHIFSVIYLGVGGVLISTAFGAVISWGMVWRERFEMDWQIEHLMSEYYFVTRELAR